MISKKETNIWRCKNNFFIIHYIKYESFQKKFLVANTSKQLIEQDKL